MKRMMLALCLAAIAGCSTLAPRPDISRMRALPSPDMEPCPVPAPLVRDEEGRVSFGTMTEKLGEVSELYKMCQAKQKVLSDWIKRGQED